MKEYKTVAVEADQGWGGAKGTIHTNALDRILNQMAKDGWELAFTESLDHTAGTRSLLCIFTRDVMK